MYQTTNKIFRGPSAYTEEDKDYFKGRAVEVQQLLYKVEHSDFCVCYARSGEGKSSLINAGLIPELKTKQMFPIKISFDVDPKGYLQDVDFDDYVWKKIEAIDNLFVTDSVIIYPDQKTVDKLWWKLRSKDFRLRTGNSLCNTVVPVLIFDQFEEVFTKPRNLQWTYKFFKWLEELYKDEVPDTNYCEQTLPKKFKALFSLRNEYVSELDYWSMDKFYIPSLKNNRYYLKPLTIAAAQMVVEQWEDRPKEYDEDIIKIATDQKYQFIENLSNDSNKGPCVSALILSLVLSKMEQSDEVVKQKLLELKDKNELNENHNSFMEFLLDHIYEKALLKCKVSAKSPLRDMLEEALIDDNGRRKPTRIEDLKENVRMLIGQLERERIICVNNGNVELSHDCIRATVARHRRNRLKQLKEQKETAFLVPTLLLLFIASTLGVHTILKETTLLNLDSNDTQRLFWMCEAVNVINIPLLVVSYVKRIKKTFWLSFGGFIYSLLFLFLLRKGDLWSATNIICLFTTIIPLGISIFAWFNKKALFSPFLKTIINNIPFLVYLFFILLFTFYECIWGNFYGISLIPKTSFWGIILLPPLACYITTKIMISERILNDKSNRFLSKVKRILPHALYLCVLIVLACENAFWRHIILPYIIILLVVCVFVYYSYFCFKQTSTQKRVLASIFNYVFFLFVFIANLGFNPLKISYNSAKIVFNWIFVYSLSENGKWGVIDAFSGDTIIPCVMNSGDFKAGGEGVCEIKGDTCMNVVDSKSIDGTFKYDDNTHIATGCIQIIPKLEDLLNSREGIKDKDGTSTDSLIDCYSAKVYKEMRKANIHFLLSGQAYTLKDLPLFHKLDSLQFCIYKSVLEKIFVSYGTNCLTDTEFYQMNRALARSFLLCAIKDKINKQDLRSLFTLNTLYSILYFSDDASYSINFHGQFFLAQDGQTETNFCITGKDFKDKGYSYYYMFLQVVSCDISASIPNLEYIIRKSIEINTSFRELISEDNVNSLKMLLNTMPIIDTSLKDKQNRDKEILLDFLLQNIGKLKEYYKWGKDAHQYAAGTKEKVDQLLDEMNRLKIGEVSDDDSFIRLNKKTSDVLISYIDKNPMSPYNNGFVKILQALYSAGFYRGHDMNDYVNKVDSIVKKKNDLSYEFMKDYREYENIMKKEKEYFLQLSDMLQNIIDAMSKPQQRQ